MSALDKLLRAHPSPVPLSRAAVQHIFPELKPADLQTAPYSAYAFAKKIPYRDSTLGQFLEHQGVIESLDLPTLVDYIRTVAHIKGSHMSPQTYGRLETAIIKDGRLSVQPLCNLLTHYIKFNICPPVPVLDSLSGQILHQIRAFRIKDVATLLKFGWRFKGVLEGKHSLEQVAEKLFLGLERTWPMSVQSAQEYLELLSILHSFAMLEWKQETLWTPALKRALQIAPRFSKDVDARIVALTLHKTRITVQTLLPQTAEVDKELWGLVSARFKVDPGHLMKGESDTTLAKRIESALISRHIPYVKNQILETCFLSDLFLPPNSVLEIDGPFHFIRRTDESKTTHLLWNYVMRDKVLQAKGFAVKRVSYQEIDGLDDFRLQDLIQKRLQGLA